MKLRILSVILFSVSLVRSNCQSLQVVGGDTAIFSENLNVSQPPAAHLYVKNISGQFKTVRVSKEVISLGQNHDAYFCWGESCYGPATVISPDIIPVDVDAIDSTFKGYVAPNGTPGISEVRYCFQVSDNPTDQTCFVQKYYYGPMSVSPDEPAVRVTAVQAVYDPQTQTIHVDVAGGKIDVMNMLGQQIALTFRYDGSGMTADASSLKTGYYFLFGKNEKGPWSARVVVSRQ